MFWPFGKLNLPPSPYHLRAGVAWGLTMGAFRVGLPVEAYALGLSKYFVSAILLRCSACTVNDIFDRHLDAGVGMSLFWCLGCLELTIILAERCRSRPLPSGRISVFAATVYLLVQYTIGFFFFIVMFDGLA